MAELTDLLKKRFGYFDYNDLATQTTPLTVTGGAGWVDIPNDTLGPNTSRSERPTTVTDVWNPTLGEFDWSELSIGDTVEIRLDMQVITSSNDTEIAVQIDIAQGTASNFQVPFVVETTYKFTGAHDLNRYNGGYIGSADVRDNPAKFQIKSDKTCTVKVKGWYVNITRRSI